MNRFGYIYLTVDTLKNQVYVGKRQKSEYDSKYLGSGAIIKNIIKKRKETLKNYVLEWCETKEELYQAEKDWIKLFREECGDRCLNIADGGEGGCTDEMKDKISLTVTEYFKNPENRKKTSDATKEAMNSPEIRQRYLEGLKKRDMKGEKNPAFGRKWMNNGIEQIYVKEDEVEKYMELGFVLGVIQAQKDKIKGKIWFHNDKESHQIYKTELELYLSKNYVLGRIYKRKNNLQINEDILYRT